MSIPVVCPECSAKLNAPDSAAGKKVKCPKCQTAMVVPTPLPEEPAFEVVDEPAKKPAAAAKPVVKAKVKAEIEDDGEKPRKKRVSAEIEDDEKPRKKRQDESDEDEEDDRPRKKKKPAAGNSNMTRNIIGSVVLLVLLGVAGWVFYDKFGKKDDTANTPSGGNPPVQPGGPNLPTPPVGPGDQVDTARIANIQRLLDELDRLFKTTTTSLNQISDNETALSGSKQLQANATSLRALDDELKPVGKISAAEGKRITAPSNATAEALLAAMTKAAKLSASKELSPQASEALRGSLRTMGQALAAIEKTMKAVMPDGAAGVPPKGLPPFSAIHSLAVSPDGKRVFACGSVSRQIGQPGGSPISTSLRTWNVGSGSPESAREYQLTTESFDSSLAVSPDGNTLAAYWGNNLVFRKVDTGEVIASAKDLPKHGLYTRIAFTEDGASVVFAVDKSLVTVRIHRAMVVGTLA
jgi:hypothetical protein